MRLSLTALLLSLQILSIPYFQLSALAETNCKNGFCEDHKAYFQYYRSGSGYIWETGRILKISGNTATVTAPFLDKDQNVDLDHLGNISRDVCVKNICTGTPVYFYDNEDREMRSARVVAITAKNTIVISPGFLSSKRGMGYNDLYISQRGHCSDDLICIGDTIRSTYYSSEGGSVFGIGNAGYLVGSSEFSGEINPKHKFSQINFRNAALVNRSPDNERRIVKIQEERRIAAEKAAKEKAETDELSQLVRERIVNIDIYNNAKAAGSPHKQALLLASGPTWYRLDQTQAFFSKLSEFVYTFDAQYMAELSAIIPNDVEKDSTAKFILAAILPYLRSFGYQSMKGRYIDTSIERIEGLLKTDGYSSIKQIESSMRTRKICLQILAASLRSARTVMSDSQKEKASPLVIALGETLSGSMRVREMQKFFQHLPALEELIKELAQNPYLQGRSATDLLVIEYLKDS